MALAERIELIRKIENLRGSTVITYLTTMRQGVPGSIAGDQVRVFFEHLALLDTRPVDKLDIFLCSNGGDGTVPWRLVALFREFASTFSVLIPYRAYSAASLIALGADEIVMHPFAELGPIDPTVSNEYNPTDKITGQRLGISVEDVKAYVQFIKSTVGINHEDELVRAIEILAKEVHPIALGNVERFISQSRMIARKILRTHMAATDEHIIEEIVENMASKLYFHGHPINRKEARTELKLKVAETVEPELETAMWELYKDYELEFANLEAFNPAGDLAALQLDPNGNVPQAVGPVPMMPPQQVVQPQASPTKEYDLLHAMIESRSLTSAFRTKHRFTVATAITPQGVQAAIRDDLLSQKWSHSPVPEPPPGSEQSSTSPAGVPTGEVT